MQINRGESVLTKAPASGGAAQGPGGGLFCIAAQCGQGRSCTEWGGVEGDRLPNCRSVEGE